MNFKKNWKRFFTVSRASEGFTLVELIVVIAILAILAGIAVPAYSGYIKKANKAADLQLLGAVNTAFGAACLENTKDPSNLGFTPRVILGSDKSITGVTDFNEAFLRYFAGNEGATFKIIENLRFDNANGVFVEGTIVEFTTTINGQQVTLRLPTEDIESFENTTFYGTMGVNGVTERVDFVTSFATEIMGNPGNSLSPYIMSEDQQNALAASLNYDSYEELINDEDGPFVQICQTLAEQNPNGDPEVLSEQAEQQMLANYAVLSAAQTATNISANSVREILTSENPKELIKTGDMNTVLTNAALAYGMYTAYAYSTGNQTIIDQTDDPDAIMDCLKDPGFQQYLGTTQAQQDMEGYLSALSLASSAAQQGGSDTISTVVVNGYANTEIQNLITSIMNSTQE